MHDVISAPDRPSVYECLQCGHITSADVHPGDCAECGGTMQNRAMSLE